MSPVHPTSHASARRPPALSSCTNAISHPRASSPRSKTSHALPQDDSAQRSSSSMQKRPKSPIGIPRRSGSKRKPPPSPNHKTTSFPTSSITGPPSHTTSGSSVAHAYCKAAPTCTVSLANASYFSSASSPVQVVFPSQDGAGLLHPERSSDSEILNTNIIAFPSTPSEIVVLPAPIPTRPLSSSIHALLRPAASADAVPQRTNSSGNPPRRARISTSASSPVSALIRRRRSNARLAVPGSASGVEPTGKLAQDSQSANDAPTAPSQPQASLPTKPPRKKARRSDASVSEVPLSVPSSSSSPSSQIPPPIPSTNVPLVNATPRPRMHSTELRFHAGIYRALVNGIEEREQVVAAASARDGTGDSPCTDDDGDALMRYLQEVFEMEEGEGELRDREPTTVVEEDETDNEDVTANRAVMELLSSVLDARKPILVARTKMLDASHPPRKSSSDHQHRVLAQQDVLLAYRLRMLLLLCGASEELLYLDFSSSTTTINSHSKTTQYCLNTKPAWTAAHDPQESDPAASTEVDPFEMDVDKDQVEVDSSPSSPRAPPLRINKHDSNCSAPSLAQACAALHLRHATRPRVRERSWRTVSGGNSCLRNEIVQDQNSDTEDQ